MSNLAIQIVKGGNIKTVELESLAHPNDPFTIILPGQYRITNKTSNYIDVLLGNNLDFKDLFSNTENNQDNSFGFDIDSLPECVTTYDAIRKFLKVLVSMDYVKIIGEDWFNNLINKYNPVFIKPDDSVNESIITTNQENFKSIACELDKTLTYILKKYTVLVNGNEEIKNVLCKHITTEIEDKLLSSVDGKAYIEYDDFPSILELLRQYNFNSLVDIEINTLLQYLAILSQISAYIDKNENQYRSFISSMIVNMHGNYDITNYTRSIINHSIFKWVIPEYPSKDSFSICISDIRTKIKTEHLIGSILNIESFVRCMDKMLTNQTCSNIEQTLKHTLATICCLIGIKAELISYEKVSSGKFSDEVVRRDPLRTTRSLDEWKKQMKN